MYAILLVAAATVGADLLPVPTGDALAQAEKTVQDVFGDEMKAARTAKQKTELAKKMLETAAGSEPAGRYVLLQQARDLAAEAGDSTVGIQAVDELVELFSPEQERTSEDWARDGHRLWSKARDIKTRFAAAECYLRALDSLDGFQRAAVEGRLRELGWSYGPIDFEFGKSTEGWKAKQSVDQLHVENGLLVGRITGDDPAIICEGLAIETGESRFLLIRMAVTETTTSQIYWYTEPQTAGAEDRRIDFRVEGDGEMHTYRIDLSAAKTWQSRKLIALRIDPAHWKSGNFKTVQFSIDFIRGH